MEAPLVVGAFAGSATAPRQWTRNCASGQPGNKSTIAAEFRCPSGLGGIRTSLTDTSRFLRSTDSASSHSQGVVMSVTASHSDVSPVAESTATRSAPAGWAARRVADLFGVADVRINGSRPWDVAVHDDRLFRRVVLDGAVGLGDAYVEGWWDCDAPDQLFDRLLSSGVQRHIDFDRQNLATTLLARLTNPQSLARARRNSDAHYDLGNDLFAAMLDPTMTYTCGYWKDAATL